MPFEGSLLTHCSLLTLYFLDRSPHTLPPPASSLLSLRPPLKP